MTRAGHRDNLESVLRKRVDLLASLIEEPLDKRGLEERHDVSRSTIDRAVRELEAYDLVRRDDGEWRPTLAGRLVHRAYSRFRETAAAVLDATGLLAYLDPDCGLDPSVLAGAEVHVASRPAPYQPATVVEDMIPEADRIVGLSLAITSGRISELLHDAVLDGTEFECVYTRAVVEFIGRWQTEEREEMVATGRYRAYRTDETPPFGLFVFDRDDGSVMVLGVYDDDSNLRGLVVNDTPEAVSWAEETLERYLEDATDVTRPLVEGRCASPE